MAVTSFDPGILASMEAEQAVNLLVEHAADLQASDLFFMADEKATNISIRRLGSVQRVAMVSREQGRHLISYFKAMAGMDLSETRRPTDGRWILENGDRMLDLRINCLPTLYGEDLALRLWDRRSGLRELSELGLSGAERTTLSSMLMSPSGLILVTGPTGTGKTTTLYACLQFLNDGSRKINTLEDPIEYSIEGLRQSQVNTKIGLDFSDLLTGVLRQAPDVIMIGEIRDEDTAATAVRAANSGHLVLATLHAPTAAAAVQSMLALGAHPYYLASCLLGVVAQRLIRTLCPACRMNYDISGADTFKEVEHLLEEGEGGIHLRPHRMRGVFGVGVHRPYRSV